LEARKRHEFGGTEAHSGAAKAAPENDNQIQGARVPSQMFAMTAAIQLLGERGWISFGQDNYAGSKDHRVKPALRGAASRSPNLFFSIDRQLTASRLFAMSSRAGRPLQLPYFASSLGRISYNRGPRCGHPDYKPTPGAGFKNTSIYISIINILPELHSD
jgi:hypothetical protein